MYEDIKNGNDRILFFSGSNHSASINQLVVSHLAKTIGQDQANTIHLKSFPSPVYSLEDEQTTGIPDKITELVDLLDQFDKFVVAVPEYNGSVPGFFKNTLDWISRARKNYRVFQNKKIFLIAVSPVGGGSFALKHAGDILRRLGAEILGEQTIGNFNPSQFNGDIDKSEFFSELQGMAYSISDHFYKTK
ncbi:NADPH-dependent FMN reductase [Parapedobacter tibetensis]|uniref:NADPH-dependent FMN reductase n=1 Tax=Parapedobacter tibetensis TaxID=2972951 RepID=UPI00214DA54B|nr:NAD(P)H-dependent oxidoreductase [Parapedobacter tibetensis]